MLQRVRSALIALPFVLSTLVVPTVWPLAILCSIVVLLGLFELSEISSSMGVLELGQRFLGVMILALLPVFMVWMLGPFPNAFVVNSSLIELWALFGLGLFGVVQMIRGKKTLLYHKLAHFWVVAPFSLLVVTYQALGPLHGRFIDKNPVFLILFPLWIGDSVAYFVGKKFGANPLWEKISPKKTWEGSTAHFIASILTAVVLNMIIQIEPWKAILCGVFAGTFGQLGDLLESALKRSAQLKDSGTFLPGHGGILDRVDSLLLTIMPSATLLLLS